MDQSKKKERGAGLSIHGLEVGKFGTWASRGGSQAEQDGQAGQGVLGVWDPRRPAGQMVLQSAQPVRALHSCIVTCRQYYAEISEWADLCSVVGDGLWQANTESLDHWSHPGCRGRNDGVETQSILEEGRCTILAFRRPVVVGGLEHTHHTHTHRRRSTTPQAGLE